MPEPGASNWHAATTPRCPYCGQCDTPGTQPLIEPTRTGWVCGVCAHAFDVKRPEP